MPEAERQIVGDVLAIEVMADPTSVATDCAKGTHIFYNGLEYVKNTTGSNTDVTQIAISGAAPFTTERQVADDVAWIEYDITGDGFYGFHFEKSTPANDLAPLLFHVYIGGAWKTSGYKSDRVWGNNNSVGENRFTNEIRLSDGDGNVAGEGSSGFIEFAQMDDTDSYKNFIGAVNQIGSANNFAQLIGGSYNGAAVTKIRVMYLTGNIKSGVFKLRNYGAN